MSDSLIGKLLPSQRMRLASLYHEMAKTYRAGLEHELLEGYAKIADMMGNAFEAGRDEPVVEPKDRSE